VRDITCFTGGQLVGRSTKPTGSSPALDWLDRLLHSRMRDGSYSNIIISPGRGGKRLDAEEVKGDCFIAPARMTCVVNMEGL
jgi:hypothetical protein